jgi:hypothetical protein
MTPAPSQRRDHHDVADPAGWQAHVLLAVGDFED